MNAIKKLQWFVLAACLFVMGTIRVLADDQKDDAPSVPVPIVNGELIQEGNHRTEIAIPFIAYYQGETIYVSTLGEFMTISVSVVNETTGGIWNSTTDISDGMGEISIAGGGAGSYTVEIITEYGECFTGSFRL